jgi:hypothetical protein
MHPSSPPEGEPYEWARAIGPETFEELTALMRQAESLPTKLAAIREILDRGYGRAPLAANGDAPSEGPILLLRKDDLWPTDPAKAIPDPSRR